MVFIKNSLRALIVVSTSVQAAEVHQPAQITEVDIITNQGTFKRPICYVYGPSIDISTEQLPSPLASYDEFKQIAEIQKHNPSVLQRPILPLNKGKKRSHEVFYRSVHDAKHQRNPLITELAFDAYTQGEKDFHIGHEVGHLQSSFVNATQMQIKANKKTHNQKIVDTQNIETLSLTIAAACALSYVFGSKKNSSYKSLALGVGALSLSTYARARYKGEQIAKTTREEEFACDEFAVNTGRSPAEKIRIAEGGISYINRLAPPPLEYLRRLFFTSIHPSSYARVHKLRKMADEQKTMIELQPNITLSDLYFAMQNKESFECIKRAANEKCLNKAERDKPYLPYCELSTWLGKIENAYWDSSSVQNDKR